MPELSSVVLRCVAHSSHGLPCEPPTGWRCEASAVPGCPVALCVKHLAGVFEFVAHARDAHFVRSVTLSDEGLARAATASYPGVVYYVRVGFLVKIGHTRDLTTRLKSYPPDAKLLGVEPGDTRLEAERHAQFAGLLSHRREWFSQGPELLAHIATLPNMQGAQAHDAASLGSSRGLLSMADASRVLGVPVDTIKRWRREGRITTTKSRGRVWVDPTEVGELVAVRPRRGKLPQGASR